MTGMRFTSDDGVVVPADVAVTAADTGVVRFYPCPGQTRGSTHDMATKASVARAIADLLDLPFAEERYDPPDGDTTAYLVPSHTLDATDPRFAAGAPPLASFFGGFVPYPFVGSKLISHCLVSPDAVAPPGWSHDHGNTIRGVVLKGYAAFSAADACRAADLLLLHGPVRVKEGDGVGGAGQKVIHDRGELELLLAQLEPQLLARHGLVLEQDLADGTTCSVGQVQVGPWRAAYYGMQILTTTGRGKVVYGGSQLTLVRGGLDALLLLPTTATVRHAIEQALVYHEQAMDHYPGLVASRCNYDVVQGYDTRGSRCSGVLEQSWRIGGASGAEIAALQAFKADPALQVVRATARECYGDAVRPPAGAKVHYDGPDPDGERLLKYVEVETFADD